MNAAGRAPSKPLNVPRRQLAAATTLIGALPRTATGVPVLRPIHLQDAELQPTAARLQSAILPDNPLVFEGMDTIYLNSEKAPELTVNQVYALMAWLNTGGHLIVGIEQITDVNATPWLRKLVPCDLTDMRTCPVASGIASLACTALPLAAADSTPARGRLPVEIPDFLLQSLLRRH